MPSTAEALPARGRKGFGFGLQVTNRPLGELPALRLGHVQQAEADDLARLRKVRSVVLFAISASLPARAWER